MKGLEFEFFALLPRHLTVLKLWTHLEKLKSLHYIPTCIFQALFWSGGKTVKKTCSLSSWHLYTKISKIWQNNELVKCYDRSRQGLIENNWRTYSSNCRLSVGNKFGELQPAFLGKNETVQNRKGCTKITNYCSVQLPSSIGSHSTKCISSSTGNNLCNPNVMAMESTY